MNNLDNKNKVETKDLILTAFLQLKGHQFEARKEGDVGIYTFNSNVKPDIADFYSSGNEFKKFHNHIRDIKQYTKSL